MSGEFRFSCTLGDLQATRALAAVLAAGLPGGALVGLSGPLGAGKTEMVRAVADWFGAGEEVASPTFVLERVYAAARPGPVRELLHWDLYRLSGGEVPGEIVEYRGDPSRICFIEWPERIPALDVLLDIKLLLDFPAPRPPFSGASPASERGSDGSVAGSGSEEDQGREITIIVRSSDELAEALRQYRAGCG